MKTIKLFNAVINKKSNKEGEFKFLPKYGVILDPKASLQSSKIEKYLSKLLLDGEKLNKTFHKSWNKILSSTRSELALHQILHYMTTYGTNHTSDFIYIPTEELDIPEVNIDTIDVLVIRGLDKEEIIEKCMGMLKSGVALKEETINDLFEILSECHYEFTQDDIDVIKNKEALMYVRKKLGVLPTDPVELVRYCVYVATGSTLLIKNKSVYKAIESAEKEAVNDLTYAIAKSNEVALASVFNRFKPIFLSIKKILDKEGKNKINKISKLSKEHHKPMSYNILNNIGSCSLEDLIKQKDNLMNANFFQLARCLNFLKKSEVATYNIYNVRNGKSYVKEASSKDIFAKEKIEFILGIMREKYCLDGVSVYVPDNVEYALPTSEKNFVGNIPMGTKFVSSEKIAYGIYWENSGGACDIDISALSTDEKIGWNSNYAGEVLYSGDITNAPKGAVEYISAANLKNPYLIMCNIYRGEGVGSKMKVVLGNSPDINKAHMMSPNDVWFSADTESVKKESIVGLMFKEDGKHKAVIANVGIGGSAVSYSNERSSNFRTALFERYANNFLLNEVLVACGAKLVGEDEATIDLTPRKLEKDTILNLFGGE